MNPADVALDPCPFCGSYLSFSSGKLNKAGRCDTDGCWMHDRKFTVPLSDPHQVEQWNTRTALRTQAPMPAASAEPVAWMYVKHTGQGLVSLFRRTHCDGFPVRDETPLYAAPPVQAPMPGEVGELVERLGHLTWEAWEDEPHDCEILCQRAAALIQSLQREVDRLKDDCAMLEAAHKTAEMRVTAAQRVKDEAVGLLDRLRKFDGWDKEYHAGEALQAKTEARALISQHGGKHG